MGSKITFADIFSGCGGLSYGFATHEDFKGILAVDHSEPAGKVFQDNHPGMPFELHDLYNEEEAAGIANRLTGHCDVLLGGPPCQGFSTLGKRRGSDRRSTLVDIYLKLVSAVRPKVVIVENVRGIKSMDHPSGMKYPDFMHYYLRTECDPGYDTDDLFIDTAEYGMAQTRVRYIFIAVRRDVNPNGTALATLKAEILAQRTFQTRTLKDVIGDLPHVESGEGCEEMTVSGKGRGKKIIYNHKAMKHSSRLIERLRHVPVGGGLPDVPRELLTAHLQKMLDGSYGSGGHVKNIYGRLDWNKPCGTVVAGIDKITCGRFVHPVAHRLLTPRECARIQSFPDNFKFSGGSVAQYYMIGNAVPPLVSAVLANAVVKALRTGRWKNAKLIDNHTNGRDLLVAET